MLLVRAGFKDVVIITLSQGERRRERQPLTGHLAIHLAIRLAERLATRLAGHLAIRGCRDEGKQHHDDALKPPDTHHRAVSLLKPLLSEGQPPPMPPYR